ncbi:RND transporter [Candidatus Riflebacteria bacterium]
MKSEIINYLDSIPFAFVVIICLTLGLAPFSPPHIVEKLQLLFSGELKKAIDWFDLFLHGTPWLLLFFKIIRAFFNNGNSP